MTYQKEKSFVKGRLKSIGIAAKGAIHLIMTEHSIISQLVIALLVTLAGFYFQISKTEWMFQVFAIGLVLSIEGMNTALEKFLDLEHPEEHAVVGKIKDIAAGAVLFAGIASIIIGCIIYIPYLKESFF
ncbi:MAG: diacylglycerol kinase family protein [Flavobacterium sp.]